MVIVSKDWMENVEDTKPLLDPNTLIMASPVAVNSNENTVRNDWKQQVQSSIIGTQNNRSSESPQCARVVLYCQPNSHPFQTRTLLLEPNQEVKVGRSIARNRVSENTAIFDCKVLSRNHAVIWYSDGKFYIKDTRSSNGTFINEQRISQSEPEELHFGDIIKFGVDVVENSRQEVHGCIIASVKLYLPDGREFISNSSSRSIPGEGVISLEELHRLHHYMQEAVQREKLLEVKLHDIQKIIEVTRRNTTSCWQAMIDEDRLLNRIDILENKLQFFQKNAPENSLRDEILKLQEDKCLYQNSAKEALRKVYQERMDATQKLSTIERALCSSEDECSLLRDQLLRAQQNLQEVNARLTRFEAECKEYREKSEKAQNQVQKQDTETQQLYAQLNEKGEECEEYKSQIDTLLAEKHDLEKRLKITGNANDEKSEGDTISTGSKPAGKGTVMKWFENSELKNKEESADIIRAICNDTDDENGDEIDIDVDLSGVYNKLTNLEKNLSQLANELKKDEKNEPEKNSTSVNSPFNNGNSNTEPKYEESVRSDVSTLMEVYNELFQNVSYLKSAKENMQHREKNIEVKFRRAQEELNNLRLELEARPTYNQFKEKVSLNEVLQNDIAALNLKQQEMQEQIDKVLRENVALQESMNVKSAEKINISLQTEPCEEKKDCKQKSTCETDITSKPSSDLDDDLVDSDLEVLRNPAVQQEEELIIFKEKYECITNENLELKQTIAKLQNSESIIQRTGPMRILLGGAIFVIFLSFIISAFFNL
ncbi:sarcolemmal membrane-associated protein [Hermetia illucens]|nr:sarcolemmal membrane-associated protein [Hermetia illucens]